MFRFTIREIFLFTVIVAVLLGWFLDHRQLQQRHALSNRVLLQGVISSAQKFATENGQDLHLDSPVISITAKTDGQTTISLREPRR